MYSQNHQTQHAGDGSDITLDLMFGDVMRRQTDRGTEGETDRETDTHRRFDQQLTHDGEHSRQTHGRAHWGRDGRVTHCSRLALL